MASFAVDRFSSTNVHITRYSSPQPPAMAASSLHPAPAVDRSFAWMYAFDIVHSAASTSMAINSAPAAAATAASSSPIAQRSRNCAQT
jgi:hypothetical protein